MRAYALATAGKKLSAEACKSFIQTHGDGIVGTKPYGVRRRPPSIARVLPPPVFHIGMRPQHHAS